MKFANLKNRVAAAYERARAWYRGRNVKESRLVALLAGGLLVEAWHLIKALF